MIRIIIIIVIVILLLLLIIIIIIIIIVVVAAAAVVVRITIIRLNFEPLCKTLSKIFIFKNSKLPTGTENACRANKLV